MRRRVQLPGAAELFRVTTSQTRSPVEFGPTGGAASSSAAATPAPVTPLPTPAAASRRGSQRPTRSSTGRQRHDEKITVYLSSRELLELERVRLDLRAEYDIVTDRGRIVREAIAIALADLHARGAASVLLRRLADSV